MCYHPPYETARPHAASIDHDAAMSYATTRRRGANSEMNKLYPEDRAVHGWYRFVLSFPPHLVRTYLERFDVHDDQRVLDPFCGTGTVLVEAKKAGVLSVGVEVNPMAYVATRTKTDWSPDPDGLVEHAMRVAALASSSLLAEGIEDSPVFFAVDGSQQGQHSLRTLSDERAALLLSDSISPLPLHKILVLLETLERQRDDRYHQHESLALAKALVYSISNLHFGPEVGVGAPKLDAPVVSTWLSGVRTMADDLRQVQALDGHDSTACVHHADARQIPTVLEPASISAVITSPPYPNEKDYTRATRLESVLLGFINNKEELRALKRGLVRSNTRGVYKEDDDDQWIANHPEIGRIADQIEARRIELGKTSGFERMYARVTRLYFGGMARHLASLRTVLRPGAQLAYVVGDQASYLRVMIPTGQLLADIARSLGYDVTGIDLFRTRLATATKQQLREEVVLLQWPG